MILVEKRSSERFEMTKVFEFIVVHLNVNKVSAAAANTTVTGCLKIHSTLRFEMKTLFYNIFLWVIPEFRKILQLFFRKF